MVEAVGPIIAGSGERNKRDEFARHAPGDLSQQAYFLPQLPQQYEQVSILRLPQ
jgi:hypothetical protein